MKTYELIILKFWVESNVMVKLIFHCCVSSVNSPLSKDPSKPSLQHNNPAIFY